MFVHWIITKIAAIVGPCLATFVSPKTGCHAVPRFAVPAAGEGFLGPGEGLFAAKICMF